MPVRRHDVRAAERVERRRAGREELHGVADEGRRIRREPELRHLAREEREADDERVHLGAVAKTASGSLATAAASAALASAASTSPRTATSSTRSR
jgi:hypothetical protein